MWSLAFPTGIEPAHTASEADALSTELREHRVDYTIKVNYLQSPSRPDFLMRVLAIPSQKLYNKRADI